MGLRALLVALLLLNGMGGMDVFAASSMDCCGEVSCDCDCAAPQVATLPGSLTAGVWATALPRVAFVVRSFQASPRTPPFRPPA